jgi:hypothetical protein
MPHAASTTHLLQLPLNTMAEATSLVTPCHLRASVTPRSARGGPMWHRPLLRLSPITSSKFYLLKEYIIYHLQHPLKDFVIYIFLISNNIL